VNVMIPSATPPGAYYLLACADDMEAVAESNETNNCIASSSTVQVNP
jgi:subtilase family serine protease